MSVQSERGGMCRQALNTTCSALTSSYLRLPTLQGIKDLPGLLLSVRVVPRSSTPSNITPCILSQKAQKAFLRKKRQQVLLICTFPGRPCTGPTVETAATWRFQSESTWGNGSFTYIRRRSTGPHPQQPFIRLQGHEPKSEDPTQVSPWLQGLLWPHPRCGLRDRHVAGRFCANLGPDLWFCL